MRKFAALEKFPIVLVLFFHVQIQAIAGQNFGREPLVECWRISAEESSSVDVASDNINLLFTSFGEGSIDGISKNDARVVWHSEIGGEIIAPVVADSERVYITSKALAEESGATGSTKITVRALSASTGVTRWQKNLDLRTGGKIYAAGAGDKLYVLSGSGELSILNKASGNYQSQSDLGLRANTEPLFHGNKFYFGTDDSIVAVVAENGRLLKRISVKDAATALLPENSVLYAGDGGGTVSAIDTDKNATRWKARAGGEITGITKTPYGLLICSVDNFVYLLSEKNGKRQWKARLSGRVGGVAFVEDGVALVLTSGGADAVFLDVKNGRLINRIEIESGNYFTARPAVIGNFIILRTARALLAYSSEGGRRTSDKKPS